MHFKKSQMSRKTNSNNNCISSDSFWKWTGLLQILDSNRLHLWTHMDYRIIFKNLPPLKSGRWLPLLCTTLFSEKCAQLGTTPANLSMIKNIPTDGPIPTKCSISVGTMESKQESHLLLAPVWLLATRSKTRTWLWFCLTLKQWITDGAKRANW